MSRPLHVGRGLEWPAKLASQAIGVLGMRGAGKSNLGRVYAEELFSSKIPFVVFDPIGNWYGIRAGRDGRPGGGIPVPIFGGDHGDLPLDRASGQKIADLVIERKLSCVLDLSHADFSETDKRRFLIDFGDRLFRKKTRESGWLTLLMEEADDYAPQTTRGGGGGSTAETLGMFQRLVKRGRFKGLGALLITQRSAAINKDLLYMVGTLVVFRTTGPRDQDAVAGWVKHNALGDELLESLPRLEDGEAWVIAPEALDTIARVRFRRMTTFDTGATPEHDGDGAKPATLADIDVPALSKELLATIEKAKAEDPRELRRQVADLRAQLAKAQAARPAPAAAAPKVVERQAVKADLVKRLETACSRMIAEAERHGKAMSLLWNDQGEVHEALLAALKSIAADRAQAPPAIARSSSRPSPGPHPLPPHPRPAAPRVASFKRDALAGDGSLAAGERKVLTALATYHPSPRTKTQVAILTGYASNGGGFNNYLSALRSKGLLDGSRERLSITDAGLATLGPVDPLPTGAELLEHWLRQVGRAEGLILRAAVEAYPEAVSKEQLAERTGYATSGGGFNNALSRLRTLELITGRGEIRASDDLVEGGSR